MAAGVPVVATRIGALPELVETVVEPGDEAGLAAAAKRLYADDTAGERGLAAVRARCAPAAVAEALRAVYGPPQ